MKHPAVAVSVLLLSTLFSVPAVAGPAYSGSQSPRAMEGKALVYIIRDYAEPTGYSTKFYLGDTKIAELKNNRYSYFYIDPGNYQFHYKWPALSGGRTKEFEELLESGKTYFFELKSLFDPIYMGGHQKSVIQKYTLQKGLERTRSCCSYAAAIIQTIEAKTGRYSAPTKQNASNPPATIRIVDLLAGNTAVGSHSQRNYSFRMYLDPNGSLVEIRDGKKNKRGRWKVDGENQLCITWSGKSDAGEKCLGFEENQDGTYSLSRGGKERRRIHRIINGKRLDS